MRKYYFITYRHEVRDTGVDDTDNAVIDRHPIDWLAEGSSVTPGGFDKRLTILFYKRITRSEYLRYKGD